MWKQDHPRACGANETLFPRNYSLYGSSPRVRGKPSPTATTRARGRIIPARAGQTSPCCPHAIGSSDHPRACGANFSFVCSNVMLPGSSPRVRGKRLLAFFVMTGCRIIPARAGQTSRPCSLPRISSDHPRACGANIELGFYGVLYCGSSPRVRGKRWIQRQSRQIKRIIPARAGQTPCACRGLGQAPDHPRACGANPVRHRRQLAQSGSSPRVRGKLLHHKIHYGALRIIPARAGQTCSWRCRPCRKPDHPRACGANPCQCLQAHDSSGSSPRVRGKLISASDHRTRLRIIPARAGQTADTRTSSTSKTDHPRACGANLTFVTVVLPTIGSSPRVRGKRRASDCR